jgi:hypothetical protein
MMRNLRHSQAKTLKRAMYGRAGIELLRTRMMPLHEPDPICSLAILPTESSLNLTVPVRLSRCRCRYSDGHAALSTVFANSRQPAKDQGAPQHQTGAPGY